MSDFLTVLRRLRAKIDGARQQGRSRRHPRHPATEGRTDLTRKRPPSSRGRAKVKALDNSSTRTTRTASPSGLPTSKRWRPSPRSHRLKSPAQAAHVKSRAHHNKRSDPEWCGVPARCRPASSHGGGDAGSFQRLSRHMQEGAWSVAPDRRSRRRHLGLRRSGRAPVPSPTWICPGRCRWSPFADICSKHRLPASGMTVNISRITTATSAAARASETRPCRDEHR